MSRWNIQPAGVRSVLASTEGVAAEFEGQAKSLNAALGGAAAESSSGIVAAALDGFARSVGGSITFVFTRTGASLGAAAHATNAYVAGDLEMAANAQTAATAAPDPLASMPGQSRGGR